MPPVLDPHTEASAVSAFQPEKEPFVAEMLTLCAEWTKKKSFPCFSNLISYCLTKDLMSLSDFRDYFHIAPAAVVLWALGSSRPPDLMQDEIVEFIERRAGTLPKREERAQDVAAMECFKQRVIAKLEI